MKTLKTIIIIFLLVFAILLLHHLTKKQKKLAGAAVPEHNTLLTRIMDIVNNLFPTLANISIGEGDFSGTLNNMILKDVIKADNESITVMSVVKFTYSYNIKSIEGLGKLKVSNLKLELPKEPSKEIKITGNLSLESLSAMVDLSASASSYIQVSAQCDYRQVTLKNITGDFELILESDCTKITQVSLTKLNLTFQELNLSCDIKVEVPPLGFVMLGADRFGSVTNGIRDNLYRLKDPLEKLIKNYLIGLPISTCIYLPNPPSCLTGFVVEGQETPQLWRFPITYEACLSRCQNAPPDYKGAKCQAMSWSVEERELGTCMLFKDDITTLKLYEHTDNPPKTYIWLREDSKLTTLSGDKKDLQKETLYPNKQLLVLDRGVAFNSAPEGLSAMTQDQQLRSCFWVHEQSNHNNLFKDLCNGIKCFGDKCTIYSAPTPQKLNFDLTACSRHFGIPNIVT